MDGEEFSFFSQTKWGRGEGEGVFSGEGATSVTTHLTLPSPR
jgi:hypothetical protein